MRNKYEPRFELMAGPAGTHGVYDNKAKRVVATGLTREAANEIITDQIGRDLDRTLIKLANNFLTR